MFSVGHTLYKSVNIIIIFILFLVVIEGTFYVFFPLYAIESLKVI